MLNKRSMLTAFLKNENSVKKTVTRNQNSFDKYHANFVIVVACADAYLTPCIKRYVDGFTAGFQDGLKVSVVPPYLEL